MKAVRIDNQGYFVEDIPVTDPQEAGADIVFAPVPQPCMQPRWDGTQWVEEKPEELVGRSLKVWRATTVVSAFQAQAALTQAGYMDDIQVILDDPETDPLTVLAWNKATTFKRTSPTLLELAGLLGLTDTEVDDLFKFATTIEA